MTREGLVHGPTTARSGRSPVRVALGLALALVAAGLVLVVNPTRARAHNDLVSSVPADGGSVTALPFDASLVFSETLGTTGLQVAVTDSAGATVAGLSASRVDGATLVQPLPSSMAAGSYTLAYRVVSVDGHPVGGTLGFTVTAAPAPAAAPTPASTPASSPASTPASTSASTPPAAPSGTSPAGTPVADRAGSAQAVDEAAGGGFNSWWLLVVLAVALAAVAVVVARRSRSRRVGDAGGRPRDVP